MKKVLAITAAAVTAGVMTAPSAHAMTQCGDRDAVIATLSDKHLERHIGSGFQSASGLMEIWASETKGTWTILLTRPDGKTCVVASGSHWLEALETEMISGEPV